MTGALDPAILAEIRARFAAQGLMATLGAEVLEVAPGLCRIAAPIRLETGQQHGHAHAGLTFAIADSACGYAALSMMPPEAEVVSVEMKINLLKPARGDRLIATGRVIRAGRRLTVVQGIVVAEDATGIAEVALLQGTMIPVAAS